jgi:glutaredoxin
MPLITLYTRRHCCLCDQAKEAISAARTRVAFDYEEFDIDTDPELVRLYNDEVPVIAIDRVTAFRYKVDMDELLKRLAGRA